MMKVLAWLSEDFAHRTNVLVALACGILAAGIFTIDVASLPLGVAAGVAYIAVVLLSLYLPRWQYPIFIAGIVSVLTVMGFLLSEPAGIPWMVVANRLLALAAIWLTAVMGSRLVYARRRKSDDALRVQKRFSDTLFETTPAVVLLLDSNGRITGINPYLERVSGYTVDEVLGEYWFEIFGSVDGQPINPESLKGVAGNGADKFTSKPIVTKNGQQRQIEWRATTLRDAAGKVVGYMNVGHDVTHRIEHEKALQMARQEITRARNAKSRFLETTSNDLRHHLQTLNLLNGTLRRVFTEPKAQEMFTMQADALGHLSDLLNSLLEITELESGDVELEITETSMPEIFRRLRGEFEYEAQAKGLKLQFDSQAEVVISDRRLLTQIIRIMVSNAVRYTSQGIVNVSCRRESSALKVIVEDSGVGMDADQLDGIFDEFYRIDKDPSGRNGSLGLGLSIVKRSAELLGTKVEVESEPGCGSRFSIVVPSGSQAIPQSAGPTE